MSEVNRRQFLRNSAVGLGTLGAAGAIAAQDAPAKAAPSERLQVGCIGVAGRAAALLHGFASLKETEVVRICDIDAKRLGGAVQAIQKRTGKAPAADSDFRKLTDDPKLDVIAIGTPDHWH